MDNKGFTLSADNEKRATLAQLQFIFVHAEKQLNESLKSADEVLNRSTVLMGILFTIITSAVGYLAINIDKMYSAFFVSTLLVLLYSFYLLFKLKPNILGATYMTTGREPKNVFHDETYNKHSELEYVEKEIYIDCINRYQDGIEHNNSINKVRWLCFRNILNKSIYIPVVFTLIYLVLFFYSCT